MCDSLSCHKILTYPRGVILCHIMWDAKIDNVAERMMNRKKRKLMRAGDGCLAGKRRARGLM